MSLRGILLERLGQSSLDGPTQRLIVAAFDGDDPASAYVSARPTGGEDTSDTGDGADARAYLKAIEVSSFRGIGPPARLQVEPGPGLTLIMGRNGSGKSSFAEGAEIALTAANQRWDDLPAAWRETWRNLHHDAPPVVTVELLIEGEPGTTTVRRTWPGAKVDSSRCEVRRSGGPAGSIEDLGWSDRLRTHRPFLSYAELGKILTGRPKDMHDALASILGMEQLTGAEIRLDALRKDLEAPAKRVKAELTTLLADLDGLDDPRARAVRAALTGPGRDLEAVAVVIASDDGEVPDLSALRRAAGLTGPDPAAIAEAAGRLRAVASELDAVRDTAAEDARRTAALLAAALDHRRWHGDDERCPVCHTPAVLDAAWAASAEREVVRLRDDAAKADDVRTSMRTAIIAGRALITSITAIPDDDLTSAWVRGRDLDDPRELADHLERHGPALHAACAEVRAAAVRRLANLESQWRPIAGRLAAWLPDARRVDTDARLLGAVITGRDWLTKAANAMRNDQLRPLAEESAAIWNLLRHESNVTLGPVTLAGKGSMKRVLLDVQVDGSDASALGVMSQGELHSLALALFLPRVTVSRSPFGFVVIDDPVQSMDPAKVEGLAQVLSRVAEQRQVIVFTHDTRLREAVTRLQLPATVLEVSRKEGSVVRIRPGGDEVSRALDDARAISLSAKLPPAAALAVVAGLCRTALEAAFVEVLRRKLLGTGVPYDTVQQRLDRARSLSDIAALAAFGEIRPRADVAERLQQHGAWAEKVFGLCNKGVHGAPARVDLKALVDRIGDLTKVVRREW